MTSIAARLDRYWFPAAPPERLATLRILVGGFALVYLLVRSLHLFGYATFAPQGFRPIGVVSLIDAPLTPWSTRMLVVAAILLAGAFALGCAYRITAPLFAACLLWVLTYRNSWGMIFHTENLLVLHVAILAVAPAADAWSIDAHRRGQEPPVPDLRYGWAPRLMAAVVMATYLLAGIAKIRLGGWDWSEGEVLRNYVATDNLRKLLLGSVYSPVAVPLLGQEWLFRALALMTFAVELGAPIALVGGRIATAWVLSAVAFHYGVLVLMAITFPYPMTGIAFACFFPVERLAERVRARWQRWRRARSHSQPL